MKTFIRSSPLLRLALVAVVPLGLVAAGAGESFARQSQAAVTAWNERAAPPFGVGERADYQVKLGAITVGSGAMEITGVQEVNGHDTFHAVMSISGGLPLARVNDRFESWIDVDGLFSRRFKQDQHEITFKRNRTYEFYPERKMFRRLDNGELGTIPTDRPLDDVAFLYYVRTLPLKPGDVYEIPRYFKDDGNPVIIKVLRRETIEVPAGRFHTVVVRPIIKTDGLFGEGGEAEVYFTDDSRRMLVQLRSKVPIVGSLSLHLKEYRTGEPFAAAR